MNTRFKVGTILAGAALAATSFVGAASAASTNLLNNGALMPTTAGWSRIGEGTFTSAHLAGATIVNTKDSMKESTVAGYQCVVLPDNWTYTLKGSLRVQPDQERDGSAQVLASYFESATCAGPNVDMHTSQKFVETDGWTEFSMKLWRTNGKKAKSMAIVLLVEKGQTNRIIKKDKPFAAQFKNFELTGDAAGGTMEEPEVPPAPPVPPKAEPTPEKPTLEPVEPTTPEEDKEAPVSEPDDAPEAPGAPTADGLPEDDEIPTVQPAAPDAPTGEPSAIEPQSTGEPTATSPTESTSSGDGSSNDRPAKRPTLEPQASGGPLHSTTPTPGDPATGGDGTSEPTDDFVPQEGETDVVDEGAEDDGLPIGLLSILGFGGLVFVGAIAAAARRRKRS